MTLYERLSDCLARQRTWYANRLEGEELGDGLEDGGAEDALREQGKNLRRLNTLRREYAALYREWENSRAMTESETADVRTQANEVSELAGRLAAKLGEAAGQAQEAADGVKEQLAELRRARKQTNRFRPGGGESGGFEKRA